MKQALYSLNEFGGVLNITRRDAGAVLVVAPVDDAVDASTAKKIAENVVSILNGHEPLHGALAHGGRAVHYSRTAEDGTIALRMKLADKDGLTEPVLTISPSGAKPDLSKQALAVLDQQAMVTVCAQFARVSGGPKPAAAATGPRGDKPSTPQV